MYQVESNPNPLINNSILDNKFFDPAYWFNNGSVAFRELFAYIASDNFYALAMTLLFFLSLFFLTVICYCVVRMFEIRKKEHAHLHHEIVEYAHRQAELTKKKQEGEAGSKNERWNKTLTFLFSQSLNDWKLAVIEADAILELLLDSMGFKGENLGEKLKTAGQADFRLLSSAWEVHTIRNKIAHEGSSFEFSQHEAKRVIAIYEQIFREFGFI